MWTKHHKKRKLGRFVLPLITVAVFSDLGCQYVHREYWL